MATKTAANPNRIPRPLLRGASPDGALAEPALDIVEYHLFEIRCRPGPSERRHLLAVDEHGRGGRLAGPRQRDADISLLRFARAIDDAAHHRDGKRLDAGIAALPFRHLGADEVLDVAGELLEGGGRGPPAAGAGRHQRHEAAEAHALEQLLRDLHLERAVAVRFWRERDADRVADALLQEHAQRG